MEGKTGELSSWFANRVGVLATMHQKEQAIAPLLHQSLGVEVVVPPNFNTDQFGTFTRDIPRPSDQLHAARLKAKMALELTGETLGIASEGTFGPHPAFPYVACDRELVILIDLKHQLEVVGEALSTDTNYSHRLVSNLADALDFAAKVGFPSHGLVAMTDPHPGTATEIYKGITAEAQLAEAVTAILNQSPTGKVHLETDMRAMRNPTRMKVIAQATENLIEKLRQQCPQCDRPGFAVVEQRRGLPCGWCGQPTELVRSHLYGCQSCGFTNEILFPNGITTADPGQCGYCNP